MASADRSVSAARAAAPGSGAAGLQGLPDGWFAELSEMWPGTATGIKVKKLLFHERSDFQVRGLQGREIYGTIESRCSMLHVPP